MCLGAPALDMWNQNVFSDCPRGYHRKNQILPNSSQVHCFNCKKPVVYNTRDLICLVCTASICSSCFEGNRYWHRHQLNVFELLRKPRGKDEVPRVGIDYSCDGCGRGMLISLALSGGLEFIAFLSAAQTFLSGKAIPSPIGYCLDNHFE